jgi:polyphosphate glucokinase
MCALTVMAGIIYRRSAIVNNISQITIGTRSGMDATAIGIDVGGTTVKGGVVDAATGVLAAPAVRCATPSPAIIDDVVAVVGEVYEALVLDDPDRRLLPVGVALSGDVRDGRHTTGVNLDPTWVGAPARDLIEARLGCRVSIINDADAAGVGEQRFGALRAASGVSIVLTFGTGIGSAILVDGRLLPNTGLGQLPFGGRPAEQTLSAVARERRGTSWSAWAGEVSDYLTLVDELLRPDRIVIGGGLIADAASFWHLLRPPCPLVPARLGNDAGIVGAAVVALERAGRERPDA